MLVTRYAACWLRCCCHCCRYIRLRVTARLCFFALHMLTLRHYATDICRHSRDTPLRPHTLICRGFFAIITCHGLRWPLSMLLYHDAAMLPLQAAVIFAFHAICCCYAATLPPRCFSYCCFAVICFDAAAVISSCCRYMLIYYVDTLLRRCRRRLAPRDAAMILRCLMLRLMPPFATPLLPSCRLFAFIAATLH